MCIYPVKMFIFVALFLLSLSHIGTCWTTEDMELFDLVENTPQNFYDLMGVDEKASATDIRKAYRKLSTLLHPDKNKDSNAEETFRNMAAVAEVLRNEERRKMYDLILKTGLPDWRAPIYYYRRVRNMGLFEMTIFLLCLTTFGQYLFAWSSYLEKKYEIEEVVLSKVRRKAKHQRKGKNAKIEEEAIVSEVMSDLQKPRCQDLFPIRLCYFIVHLIKSSPSYIASCRSFLQSRKEEEDSEEDEPQQTPRVKIRKTAAKPKIPDFADISPYESTQNGTAVSVSNEKTNEESEKKTQKWSFNTLTEHQISEFKKALKKFPNGTLQRWEKVAAYLGCSVNEVIAMVKLWKNQQFTNGVPASLQGVTGTEKENLGTELYEEKGSMVIENGNLLKERKLNHCNQNNHVNESNQENSLAAESDKIWKQEEQRSLEVALQKFPKDTPARWDKIASFVSTKTKEECVERFKILAQQVRMKKGKGL